MGYRYGEMVCVCVVCPSTMIILLLVHKWWCSFTINVISFVADHKKEEIKFKKDRVGDVDRLVL